MTKSHKYLGRILTLVGFGLALVSHFIIESVFLTAIGISMVIWGFTSIGLAYVGPRISPETRDITLRKCRGLLISLAGAFSTANVMLGYLGQDNLGFYFAIDVIAYLIITWIYWDLDSVALRVLNILGAMLFAGLLANIAYNAFVFLK
jgi:hypothetical protein